MTETIANAAPKPGGPSNGASDKEAEALWHDFYRLLRKTRVLHDLVSQLRALERWQIPTMADVESSESQFLQLNSDIRQFRQRLTRFNGPGKDLDELSTIVTAFGVCRSHSGELGNSIEMLQQEIHPTAVRNLSSVDRLLREMLSIQPEMELWIAHIRERSKGVSLAEQRPSAATPNPQQLQASREPEQSNAQIPTPTVPGNNDLQALIEQIQRLQVEVAELKARQAHNPQAASQQPMDPILERFLIAQRQLAQEEPSPSMMSDGTSTILPPPYALSDVGPRWRPGEGDDSASTR